MGSETEESLSDGAAFQPRGVTSDESNFGEGEEGRGGGEQGRWRRLLILIMDGGFGPLLFLMRSFC